MAFRFNLMAGVMALAGASSIGSAQDSASLSPAAADDQHVWLEEVRSERALAWARAESERTVAAFQADPRYRSMYDRALEVLQARDRIPFVQMRADGLYNFWQDETHVRGLVRRTDMASYRTDDPGGPRRKIHVDRIRARRSDRALWAGHRVHHHGIA